MVTAFSAAEAVRQGPVRIARAAIAGVEAEARTRYAEGQEACGYLAGPAADPGLCDEAVALPNLADRYHAMDPEAYPRTGRTFFLLDPLRFARAVEAAAAAGRPVKVVTHSHVDAGAYFSDTDARAATMDGDRPTYDLFHLVTSVRAGVVDAHRLFVWSAEARAFVEAPIRVA